MAGAPRETKKKPTFFFLSNLKKKKKLRGVKNIRDQLCVRARARYNIIIDSIKKLLLSKSSSLHYLRLRERFFSSSLYRASR